MSVAPGREDGTFGHVACQALGFDQRSDWAGCEAMRFGDARLRPWLGTVGPLIDRRVSRAQAGRLAGRAEVVSGPLTGRLQTLFLRSPLRG